MPYLDQTGPAGFGPYTGRGYGYRTPGPVITDTFASQGWGARRQPAGPGVGQIMTAISPAVTAIAPGAAGTGAGGALLGAVGGPVGLAISGGIMAVTMLIGHFRKIGAQKVAATRAADQMESLLQQNVSAYRASNRTVSEQAQCIENFNSMWATLVSKCSDPQLGSAGERCISERQRGGAAPWCPTGTGCDWFVRYLDPIEQDPDVQPDQVVGADVMATGPGGMFGDMPEVGGINVTYLLLAAAGVVLLMSMGEGGKK